MKRDRIIPHLRRQLEKLELTYMPEGRNLEEYAINVLERQLQLTQAVILAEETDLTEDRLGRALRRDRDNPPRAGDFAARLVHKARRDAVRLLQELIEQD